MRNTISSIHPHTAAKLIATVLATGAYVLHFVLTLVKNVPALDMSGVGPVLILFSFGYSFLYSIAVLIATYLVIYALCLLYNVAADYLGGIQYEIDD